MKPLQVKTDRTDRFFWAALIPLLLIVLGTLGYALIEGWSLFDALYMTVITLTTVGYKEVHEMSPAGQAFTMLLSLGGVFMLFYAATAIATAVVSGRIIDFLGSRRMERSLAELKGHMIVCGFGRMGRRVCQEFSAKGMPFVVIDRHAELFDRFELPHGIAVDGDAASDEVLERVGVRRAKTLVSVAASDADNLYITMMPDCSTTNCSSSLGRMMSVPSRNCCGPERVEWFRLTSSADTGWRRPYCGPPSWISSNWRRAPSISR